MVLKKKPLSVSCLRWASTKIYNDIPDLEANQKDHKDEDNKGCADYICHMVITTGYKFKDFYLQTKFFPIFAPLNNHLCSDS